MKRSPAHPRSPVKSSGSVLLVTMIFVVTIAAILVSYLMLVQNSNQQVARAQVWNSTLCVAESGVEEAMAHLNSGAAFSANGWTQSGTTNYGPVTRSFNGGSYSVTFQPLGNRIATIYSTGALTAPVIGGAVTRALKITAQKMSLFGVGLGAVHDIDLNGNTVDPTSWNSHDPLQSSNGLYSGYQGTNGDVATQQGFLNVGNFTINGDLYLGPNASYSGGNVTGTTYSDWNVQFPDAVLPTADTNGYSISWTPAPETTIISGNKSTVVHDFTASGYYLLTDNEPIIVEPGITVTLDIRVTIWNPAGFAINGGTTNAGSVVAYQESGTAKLDDFSGAINNRPENFFYFGLPGVTQVALSGSSDFVGVIYAPEAVVNLSGGGSANNIMGAIIGYSVKINGHYAIHYDESLAFYYNRGYIAVNWQEL